jgi:tRNA (pseudouridine54-N1)-methyltransferase
MRRFVLLALKARTSPDFDLLDLPGSGGRMDEVCRCVSSALFLSGTLRRDSAIYCCLQGPKSPPKVVSFFGETIRGIRPDELSIARLIKQALHEGLRLSLDEHAELTSGLGVAKRSFEAQLRELEGQLLYLHPRGEDIRSLPLERDCVFVLGDQIGLPRKAELFLERLGARRVSVGPKVYHASHVITICHNEMDRRGL